MDNDCPCEDFYTPNFRKMWHFPETTYQVVKIGDLHEILKGEPNSYFNEFIRYVDPSRRALCTYQDGYLIRINIPDQVLEG